MTEQVTPPTEPTNSNPTTPPPEMNTPEARTPDGTIIDQSKPPEAAPVEAKTEEAKPAGAPETYADFVIPEGATVDKAAINAATPIFKELGLSQDQAQKLVDLYPKLTGDIVKANNDAYNAMREGWVSELKADKDIGSRLDHVSAEIGKLKARMPAEMQASFNEAMNLTGAGDHPAVVKMLFEFTKLVNEGSHVAGGGPSEHGQNRSGQSKRPSLAGAMYPNLSNQ